MFVCERETKTGKWLLMNELSLCFCLLRTQINFTVAIDFTASNGELTHTHTLCMRKHIHKGSSASVLNASGAFIQIYADGESSVS